MTNEGADAGRNPWESIAPLIAEVLENLNNKRYEKTYREDLLPISKNDVVLVFRDLFITVINRKPQLGGGQQSCVWVPSQGTLCCSLQALGIVPSAPSPKLSNLQALDTPQQARL